ncbi:MAG: TonB-dependent receptor [Gemmatimonadetes bacterium]|nr:TonB-dependent receptor [Gemmatimonadota bacterium]
MSRRARAAVLAVTGVLLLTGGPSHALGQVVRGQVKDRDTGKPALGVVTLIDTAGGLIGRMPTGPQGQYALTAPRAGAYLLQFVGPGYGPYVTREFTLAAGESRIMGLEAVPLPAIALDTVIVEGRPVPSRLAGFYQRKSGGFGEFLTREELERWNPSQPTDVLRRMAGVNLVPTDLGYRVVSRRDPRCAPAVFLDGIYMGTGAEFDFDAVLTTEQIEGVETYSGAGQIPAEFNRSDCGAVVVWTRVAGPGQGGSLSHFDLAAEAGGWMSSEGLQQGRVGARGLIGVGAAEISPAVHVLVPGFRIGGAEDRSGVEIQFTVRGRPLGRGTPWYAGLGVTFLELEAPRSVADEEQYFLLLAGASLPRGAVRPMVEVQALNPFGFSKTRFQVFVGAVVKVY